MGGDKTAWEKQMRLIDDSVDSFASVMKYKLNLHRKKGHWSALSHVELINLLKEEIKELEEAIKDCNDTKTMNLAIVNECADVANYAMMIADNIITRSAI